MSVRVGTGRRAPLVLCALLLSACGGGGGGGGGGGNSPAPNPPAPNPPAPPAFFLTSANALDATKAVLEPVDETLSAVQLATFVSFFVADNGPNSVSLICAETSAPTGSATFVDFDGDRALGPGDQLTIEHSKCTGAARKIVLSLTALDADHGTVEGTVDLTLDADGGLHVQGTATLKVAFLASHFEWTVSNVSLTVTRAGIPDSRVTANIVGLLGGRSASVLIARNHPMAVAPTAAPAALPERPQYSVTVSGSVESSRLNGSLSFATQPALEGTSGEFPKRGALVLTAGVTKVRVGPSADPRLVEDFADYQLDATGAGYGAATAAEWRSLLRGEAFGWAPLRRPSIVRNEILPAAPHVGDTLYVSHEVLNPAGGPIEETFEWRRNGVLLPVTTGSQLLSGNFQHGDRIEVTVHVRNSYASDVDTAATTILNSAPAVALALAPTPARTNDALVLAETIADADGDPLQVTREWRRNGTVVDGETGTTFPASKQRRDDVVEVKVTVRDLESSTSATATATILDTPPRVIVSSPPPTVAYGMPTTFDARFTDDDGDPVSPFHFRLAHGPAGMTVDPATGRVAWTANGPMFDRTATVSWSVAADDPIVLPAAGALEVRDPSRAYPLFRTPLIDLVSNIRVGDFDGDGKTEMIVLDRSGGLYQLERGGTTYRTSWAYPFPTSPTSGEFSVATGDVDGDKHHEIFVGSDIIVKLDGVERRPVATFDLGAPGHMRCLELEYVDLDRDGAAEVVGLVSFDGSAGASIVILRAADLSLVWRSTEADIGLSLAIANVDHDAALEMITSGGFVIDGATFATEQVYPDRFGWMIAAGDVDGNGVAEILGTDFERARIYSVASGAVTVLSTIQHSITSIEAADVTGDGAADLVTADGRGLFAYRYNPGPKTTTVVFALDWQNRNIGAIAAGDVDRDGKVEIVWSSDAAQGSVLRGLFIAGRAPDALEWSSPDDLRNLRGGALARSPMQAPVPLYVGSSADDQVLFTMDPVTGDIVRSPGLGTQPVLAAIDVTDYDLDGTTEAFVATGSGAGAQLTAYDFFAAHAEWTPTIDPQEGTPDFIAHGDLTGDGKDDVAVVTSIGVAYAFDPAHQTRLWKSARLGDFGQDVAITDLDGDGVREIVAATRGAVIVFARGATPSVYTESARFTPPVPVDTAPTEPVLDIAAGDLDGDGRDEVVALMVPSYGAPEVVRLGAGLTRLGSFHVDFAAQSIAIEGSAFARKNLVLSTYRNEIGTLARPGQLVTVDAASGAEVSRSPWLFHEAVQNGIYYVDPAGDGRLRLGVTGYFGVLLTR